MQGLLDYKLSLGLHALASPRPFASLALFFLYKVRRDTTSGHAGKQKARLLGRNGVYAHSFRGMAWLRHEAEEAGALQTLCVA